MGNKMKKYILSLLAVGSQGADFTGDTDASCNLLDATCDHTGFTITFDTACQASDYKAVQWDELYADGWAQQDSNTNLYGSARLVQWRRRDHRQLAPKLELAYGSSAAVREDASRLRSAAKDNSKTWRKISRLIRG